MNHSLKYFEKFFWKYCGNTQEKPYIDTFGNTEHTTFRNLEGKTKGKTLQFCWRLVETVPRFEPFPLLQFSLSTTNAKLFSTMELCLSHQTGWMNISIFLLFQSAHVLCRDLYSFSIWKDVWANAAPTPRNKTPTFVFVLQSASEMTAFFQTFSLLLIQHGRILNVLH